MSNPYAPPPRGRRAGDVATGSPGPGGGSQPPSSHEAQDPEAQNPESQNPESQNPQSQDPPPYPQHPPYLQHPQHPQHPPYPQHPNPHPPYPPRAPYPHAQHRPPHGPSPAPDPEEVRRASRRVMDFGLLMLATLVTAAMPLPWQAAGLAFAVATVVVGIRALRAAWRAGLRTLVPLLGVGLAFALLMSVTLGAMLALWPLQVERQDCLRDALTISARETCEADFQDALQERLERATQPSDG